MILSTSINNNSTFKIKFISRSNTHNKSSNNQVCSPRHFEERDFHVLGQTYAANWLNWGELGWKNLSVCAKHRLLRRTRRYVYLMSLFWTPILIASENLGVYRMYSSTLKCSLQFQKSFFEGLGCLQDTQSLWKILNIPLELRPTETGLDAQPSADLFTIVNNDKNTCSILLRWKLVSRNLLSSHTNFSPEMSTVRMVEGWFKDCNVDGHMFKLLLSKQTPGKWLDHWRHQSGPYKTTWRLLHLCKASKERHKWRATFNRQSMPQGMLRWQEHVL